jgi:anaerobic ribonucleoside-triphosphate reductase activating protein
MGGDANHGEIAALAREIKEKLNLKVAMYSGDDRVDPVLVDSLDYYKVGPYVKELGPLDSPTTNQRFYEVVGGTLVDRTAAFSRKRIGG